MSRDTEAILTLLYKMDTKLTQILQKEKLEMATLADVQNEVTSMAAEVQAAVAALQDLAAHSADPAAINDIATRLQAAHDSLQAAVNAATPPAPPAA
jgi:hypothetical protein